jgi:hypothetical protein
LVGKEALILENEVAHDDKSDTLLIQRKKNEYDLWTKIFFWNLEQVDVDKSLVLNYRNQLTIQYNPLLNQITILKESGLVKFIYLL